MISASSSWISALFKSFGLVFFLRKEDAESYINIKLEYICMQEMIEIPKEEFEAMEEELAMLRNPQVIMEIKESLKAFREGKGKAFHVQ